MSPLMVCGLLLGLVALALSARTTFRLLTRTVGFAEALGLLGDQVIALAFAAGGLALVLIDRTVR